MIKSKKSNKLNKLKNIKKMKLNSKRIFKMLFKKIK